MIALALLSFSVEEKGLRGCPASQSKRPRSLGSSLSEALFGIVSPNRQVVS